MSCVKVEVAVQGSPSPIVRTMSVDIKQHSKKKKCIVVYNVTMQPEEFLASFPEGLMEVQS